MYKSSINQEENFKLKKETWDSKRKYQICTNCVMDTTDSKIVFDDKGVCDHCISFYKDILPDWNPSKDKSHELENIAKQIRKEGKDKEYDCIIGISGGTDSSYVTYIACEKMKLRPLIYTVDTGWNLNVAVENIERIVKAYNLEMYTEVVDWNEMRDMQLAYLKSQLPCQDIPQDHAIFAGLYNYAVKKKIKYVISGANNATECIRPPIEWVYFNDIKQIKDIHRRYGQIKIKSFPMCGMFKYKIYYTYFKGMKRVAPLDYVNYNKEEAEKELKEKFGWEDYKNKHYENIFTRFYEGYYLPKKFGYDKRKVYLSNLIITGQMSRDEALVKLKIPPYDESIMLEDKEYIAKKLDITLKYFDELINGDNRMYTDYKNSYWIINSSIQLSRLLGIEKRNFR